MGGRGGVGEGRSWIILGERSWEDFPNILGGGSLIHGKPITPLMVIVFAKTNRDDTSVRPNEDWVLLPRWAF